LLAPTSKSCFWESLDLHLGCLANLPPDWNSYGAQPPNEAALALARKVLAKAREADMVPDRIDASADDGVAICFLRGSNYADIECFNSGEIAAVTHVRCGKYVPDAWDVGEGDISLALDKIRKFLGRQSCC